MKAPTSLRFGNYDAISLIFMSMLYVGDQLFGCFGTKGWLYVYYSEHACACILLNGCN